ncbi:MAG: collagen-like protein [Chloroflexi bacterium]|nr:collagen-like protein [Chloroflexota bacterium]
MSLQTDRDYREGIARMEVVMRRRFIVAALPFALLAFATTVTFASIPDSDGTIRACYAKSGGALRVIDSSVSSCKSSEKVLEWNQSGPAGPAGNAGPAGPTGPQGPAGLTAAYDVPANGDHDELTASEYPGQTLNSIELPPGNWAVFGRVMISSDLGLTEYYAACYLKSPSDSGYYDSGYILESVSTAGLQRASQTISMMALVALPDGGTVVLSCVDNPVQTTFWSNAKIMAVQVSTIN